MRIGHFVRLVDAQRRHSESQGAQRIMPGCLTCTTALIENGVLPRVREAAVRALNAVGQVEFDVALRIEQELARMRFHDTPGYVASAKRVAYNLACNRALASVHPATLVLMTDEDMSRGTIVERIQEEEAARSDAIRAMLLERYENVRKRADEQQHNVLRCRQCGSGEVSWEQKQTRGAFGARPRRTCARVSHRGCVRARRRRSDDGLLRMPSVQSQVAHVLKSFFGITGPQRGRRHFPPPPQYLGVDVAKNALWKRDWRSHKRARPTRSSLFTLFASLRTNRARLYGVLASGVGRQDVGRSLRRRVQALRA